MNPLHRIKQLWHAATARPHGVLGMNRRNLNYIYPNNNRRDFPLSDDKLLAKKVLSEARVPVPDTYQAYGYFYDLRNMADDLKSCPDFVIKPARGRGGGGIIVIAGRDGDDWLGVGGKRYSEADIRKHISDIIFGIHSFGLADVAIIEQRIEAHPVMAALSPFGLADVRLIICQDTPIMAMSRIPTKQSDGKANLHQGCPGGRY
jgi:alpha-L-glutamate ligase-like protein